ncbi:T9SS type B sorting domain-containing protein [Flavobacterium sp. KACC 22761]|uniref:Ig-like domain-containing protein n=1 Tax=Flavobacterium sp. KACC 22761 TaxID=3092665 RepID=UPI002A75042D|nr:T9SS type B sorting domain-containing protein [Flavobacterium sp. KACC 22761]WPO80802.1 T9SS type B sorting domain-containing protein [Flavobacterium sp. KACC 22761]
MKTKFFCNCTLALILLFCNILFAFSTRHLPERIPQKETSKKTTVMASAITATGDQVYCPHSSIKIVTNVSINATEEINAIYIQISSGYSIDEDLLTLVGTHPNLTSNWNSDSGTLTISNASGKTASLSEFITAIKAVEFKNSSIDPKGIRNFSISLGQANYLPSSKHYYQFVSSPGISWGEAKRAAAASNYFGLKGYLVTITTLDEAIFVGEQLSGTGWIGGSDTRKEPYWLWETGPEEGTQFWYGRESGSTTTFAYWNDFKEPNNGGELALIGVEDYAYITPPGHGQKGRWNDSSLYGSSDPTNVNYPRGYIVEYGGMPGDVYPQITASTSLTMLSITETKAPDICGSGTSVLKAESIVGTINWYTDETGSSLIATGPDFTTPVLNSNQTFYVAASYNGCFSKRIPVDVRVNKVPVVTSVSSPDPECGSGIFFLEAVVSEGDANWYDSETGGTILGKGSLFITPSISSNTIYYVEANNNDCRSITRTPVKIEIFPLPAVQNEEVVLCVPNSVTLDAGISNMNYLWSTGEITQKIKVSQLGTYFVDVTASTQGNCSNRKTIKVIELPAPEIQKVEIDNRIVTIVLNNPESYFEYSIDGENFQNSNVFHDAPGGLQTAYAREKSCYKTASKSFIVLLVPAFFTPNNDSYNDVWEIIGIENYPEAEVTIFDRYGKFITQLNVSKKYWDGTLNKTPLPASDYWYALKIDNTQPILRGHFSLKR